MLCRTALPAMAALLLVPAVLPQDRAECECRGACPCHEEVEPAKAARPDLPSSSLTAVNCVLETLEDLRGERLHCELRSIKSSTRTVNASGQERVLVRLDLDFPAASAAAGAQAYETFQREVLRWACVDNLEARATEPLGDGEGLRVVGAELTFDLAGQSARPYRTSERLAPEGMNRAAFRLAEDPRVELGELMTTLRQTPRPGGVVDHRLGIHAVDRARRTTLQRALLFPDLLERRHSDLVVTGLTLTSADDEGWAFELELTLREQKE